MMAAALGLAGIALLSGCGGPPQQPAVAAGQPPRAVVAEVNGQAITLGEVEAGAGGELLNLSIQRQRILETALERIISAKVMALEAKAQRKTEPEILQGQVFAKLAVPTDAEVDAFYASRPDLATQDKAKIAPQIRQALANERRQAAYRSYIAGLKAKYGVKTLLGPLRVKVDPGAGPVRGPADAAVVIVEFSDFECPYCRTLSRTLADVVKQYDGKVRLVFRQFPLEAIHRNAMKAAEASVCASDQGKFWEMHDRLFVGSLAEADLLAKAADAGLQAEAFKACLSSGKAADRVRADMKAASTLGVSSTPTFFINGRPMVGAVPQAEIARVVDEELRGRK